MLRGVALGDESLPAPRCSALPARLHVQPLSLIMNVQYNEGLITNYCPPTQRLWLAAKTTDLSHGIAICFARLCCTLWSVQQQANNHGQTLLEQKLCSRLLASRTCTPNEQRAGSVCHTGMPYAKIYRGGTPVIKNNRSLCRLITVALLICFFVLLLINNLYELTTKT